MLRIALCLLVLSSLICSCGNSSRGEPETRATTRPNRKVVVLIVDSLSEPALERALKGTEYPAFQYLVRHGHKLSHVVASFPSMTVSDMSTMLTGASSDQHRIPGLTWVDMAHGTVVNYGNNLQQTLTLGTRAVADNVLVKLNQVHLSKRVTTVFEDLQDEGYSTGAINMLVYRGRTPHTLTLPTTTRPFVGARSLQVNGPDTLVFGQLTQPNWSEDNDGVRHRFGFNDKYSIDALTGLMKKNALPDFTMVYLPDNDSKAHSKGTGQMTGIKQVENGLEHVLGAYGDWNETLKHVTFVTMGDSGITPVLPAKQQPTIMLSHLFPASAVHHWGTPFQHGEVVEFAVNSRMAYVYQRSDSIKTADIVGMLAKEKRIDIISWTEGDNVIAMSTDRPNHTVVFRKGGSVTDPYGQSWTVAGDASILDLSMGGKPSLAYGRYPDALNQLWSALHSQSGKYVVVSAKEGYQFGDEDAPEHSGGAQQASLLKDDVFVPLVVTGTDKIPSQPLRFAQLKPYFISLVELNRDKIHGRRPALHSVPGKDNSVNNMSYTSSACWSDPYHG